MNDEGNAISYSFSFLVEADMDSLSCWVALHYISNSKIGNTLSFFNFNFYLQALIWSKKSSGLPITVKTAHSTSLTAPPATVTTVVLDIDIYKNEPRIIRFVCV